MFKKGSYLFYSMANGMFYFAWGIFASMLTVYLATQGMSAGNISLITSAASIAAIVTQPLAGMLADKFRSPQKVSIVCAIGVVISGMAFAYSKSFILLFIFNGLTQGLLNGITSLTDRMATASPYPYGTVRVWGSVLYAISCQISGFLFEHFPPIVNFYVFAISMIFMLVGFMGMYDVKPKVSEGNNQNTSMKDLLPTLLKNKTFVSFTIIYIIYWGVAVGSGVYMSLMIKDLGGSTSLVGTTFLLAALGEMPMVLLSDVIIKKVGYKKLLIFATVMLMIRFGWYSTLPDPKMIMYMFFFQGTTTIVFVMVAVRMMLEIVDERFVNSAYGISNMLAKGVSAVVFQIFFGQIVQYLGYAWMYRISFVLMSICLVLCIRFKVPERKSKTR